MNKLFHHLYYNIPIFFQHIAISAYGFKLKKKRYNSIYNKKLLNYIKEDSNHNVLLYNFLWYLKSNIKYYKDIKIDKENLIQSFLELPFTTKEDLRQELELRSSTKGIITISRTGGTTGKSLKVYSSEYDKAYRMAYLDYIKFRNGVDPFSKRASFGGKELTPLNDKNVLWRYNIAMNQILYASFKLNTKNVKYVFQNMKKNKPTSIDGFPSSIHLIAKHILLNNLQVDWNIKAVFPNAETLTSNVKKDIEKAFNTKVIDQYASAEGAPFIYNNFGGKYKLGNETGVFEFYKVKENIYDMVVTSLINYATPIVRYKIGDRVEIDSNKGYLNSLIDNIQIEKILGRDSDYLVGFNENIITSANMSNVIKELEGKIIQSQFIQKNQNTFIINLVVNNNYETKKDEQTLVKNLNFRLGNNNQYKFQYLSEIPKENSGKTRMIINKMNGS